MTSPVEFYLRRSVQTICGGSSIHVCENQDGTGEQRIHSLYNVGARTQTYKSFNYYERLRVHQDQPRTPL